MGFPITEEETVPQELICTIGHSNRSIEEFIELLQTHGVGCVLDIRTVPKSRCNPQLGQDSLPASLARAGIGSRYLAGLGGLRRPRKDSPNAHVEGTRITYPPASD